MQQLSLFELESPAEAWDRNVAQRALDELFSMTAQYKSSESFHDLLNFLAKFRAYSPFNGMLINIQMPGAKFVAPPSRWRRDYGRTIKSGARPIVILQPMGPVMFVFDVIDTAPLDGAPSLPKEVEDPFAVRSGCVGLDFDIVKENCMRDGVLVEERAAGSQRAGSIQIATYKKSLKFLVRQKPSPEYIDVPLGYELLLNSGHTKESKYATLVHELAHLYCGHLGTPNEKWWPHRRDLHINIREFEAESVSYLVCSRLGIDNPSDKYLAQYLEKNRETPPISLECVMKAAGLIEQMGRARMPARKDDKK